MRGIELSKAFFEEFGRPMLEKDFAEYMERIAVGLVGHGSECYGFDDEISADHDFEPGFCIWINDEDEKEFGFRLFRAYSKLPKEYMGVKCLLKSAGGSKQRGVCTISEFYSAYTGRQGAPESAQDWLYIPLHYLAEATNGEIFYDGSGEFSSIRSNILTGMPEDVRLKRIACCAFHMAQSGQYNYKRCLAHGEIAAARLALDEFVRYGAELVFLLEKKYAPYYKWVFRAMRSHPELSLFASAFEKLLTMPSDETLKAELLIEKIASDIISEFRKQGITNATCNYLESHAYSVNDHIKDNEIRNLNIIL